MGVSTKDLYAFFHARNNVLMDCEKISNPDFDWSMGSMDGAEIAELIGIYMISKLMMKFKKALFDIYRDDGLMVVKVRRT